jgi:hypothetical protein
MHHKLQKADILQKPPFLGGLSSIIAVRTWMSLSGAGNFPSSWMNFAMATRKSVSFAGYRISNSA